ncbi:hypothetical protein AGATL06_04060 [Agathobaculum sp. TL06]
MFIEAKCCMCRCVRLPSYGKFTVDSCYGFDYLIDAEKIIDDLGNEIVFPETIFKLCFGNLGEWVTAYCPMSMDHTVYSIFLILHDTIPSLDEIKAYAKIKKVNYLQARKALIYKRNLLVSGDAYDIRNIILEKLNTFQIQYEIEPPYPYIELIRQQTSHLSGS